LHMTTSDVVFPIAISWQLSFCMESPPPRCKFQMPTAKNPYLACSITNAPNWGISLDLVLQQSSDLGSHLTIASPWSLHFSSLPVHRSIIRSQYSSHSLPIPQLPMDKKITPTFLTCPFPPYHDTLSLPTPRSQIFTHPLQPLHQDPGVPRSRSSQSKRCRSPQSRSEICYLKLRHGTKHFRW
jgi:hypothetical protein